MQEGLRIVALIPAFNEAAEIHHTIEGVLAQDRVPDQIVVIPNGCTDNTAEVARRYPVTVMELPRLEHKKAEAMNHAWQAYGRDADLVISLDADTVLPQNAVADWEQEFLADADRQRTMNRVAPVRRASRWWDGSVVDVDHPRREVDRPLVGSTAKFTLRGGDVLTRLQRIEYSTCIDQAISRGYASVLAGAGAAISGAALRTIASRDDRPDGPWCYHSMVEDYELTYRLREAGGHTHISPTVRAYTDSMKTQRALYAQRMKWSTGMLQDLSRFGLNRYTYLEWFQVFMIFASNVMRLLWLALMVTFAVLGQLHFNAIWWLVLPPLFIAVHVKYALRIPHRDRTDLAYAFMIWPAEAFTWMRMRWSFGSLYAALVAAPIRRALRRANADRWAMQHKAETWGATLRDKVVSAIGRVTAGLAAGMVTLILLGATVPSLGLPDVASAIGLELPDTGVAAEAGHGSFVPGIPPEGYAPPADCRGYVALTYDDGPGDATRPLVETLNAYGMSATFFLLGAATKDDPDGAKFLADHGQSVQAHSMTHAELPNPQVEGEPGAEAYGVGHVLDANELRQEIALSADAVQDATGLRPTMFRPPYGYTSAAVKEEIANQGLVQALWTLDSDDWRGKSKEEIAKVFARAKDGDIILMHDNDQTDIDAVPLIAKALADGGLCAGRMVQTKKATDTGLNDPDTDQVITEHIAVVKP